MITLIVGHRGVGKSSFLVRRRLHFRDTQREYVELDDLIEEKIGKSIQVLFTEHGERYFRNLEAQFFLELVQQLKGDADIVLSSGFDLSQIQNLENFEILWLQRKTDKEGRIFLDRPVVQRKMMPLNEFQLRARERTFRYQEYSDVCYEMPEGIHWDRIFPREVENQILYGLPESVGGYLDVPENVMRSPRRTDYFSKRYMGRGIHFVIPEGAIPEEGENSQIFQFLRVFSGEKIIWKIESQLVFDRFVSFLSNHELGKDAEIHLSLDLRFSVQDNALLKSFSQKFALVFYSDVRTMANLEAYEGYAAEFGAHLYLRFHIESFHEMTFVYEWWRASRENRSVALYSEDGRWSWFPCFMKNRQKINYWRDYGFFQLNLPSLYDWLAAPKEFSIFGATLGEQVDFRQNALFVSDFFQDMGVPYFQISVKRKELKEAILNLKVLGLVYVDLEAPLTDVFTKESWPYELKGKTGVYADTLFLCPLSQIIYFFSAEEISLEEFFQGLEHLVDDFSEIAVWSRRERLHHFERLLPQAQFYSSRTGELRKEKQEGIGGKSSSPRILVWDAFRSKEIQRSYEDWRPRLILDLAYKEDSLGREMADFYGCAYVSGSEFFRSRSLLQIQFWKERLAHPALKALDLFRI